MNELKLLQGLYTNRIFDGRTTQKSLIRFVVEGINVIGFERTLSCLEDINKTTYSNFLIIVHLTLKNMVDCNSDVMTSFKMGALLITGFNERYEEIRKTSFAIHYRDYIRKEVKKYVK